MQMLVTPGAREALHMTRPFSLSSLALGTSSSPSSREAREVAICTENSELGRYIRRFCANFPRLSVHHGHKKSSAPRCDSREKRHCIIELTPFFLLPNIFIGQRSRGDISIFM